MTSSPWDSHYDRDRSRLNYPDENLLRLLKKADPPPSTTSLALDIGCGSGRHLALLRDSGYGVVIGTDISHRALSVSRHHTPSLLIQCSNTSLPFKSDLVDVVIAWGSLHYTLKIGLSTMIKEIHRVLKVGGTLLATLRSTRDTYLKSGRHLGDNNWITDLPDIKGETVSFYNEDELDRYFSLFGRRSFGYTERSLMGATDKVISHWIIMAEKK